MKFHFPTVIFTYDQSKSARSHLAGTVKCQNIIQFVLDVHSGFITSNVLCVWQHDQ
ncbi:hypothetical protein SDC9_203512 [bioreactor metagenome]|uniref:Uncharacterized protein n=1 Tax=bioreactor metagenome TaxID=1076179 RepID=A0A645IWQ2_9ZZZZ